MPIIVSSATYTGDGLGDLVDLTYDAALGDLDRLGSFTGNLWILLTNVTATGGISSSNQIWEGGGTDMAHRNQNAVGVDAGVFNVDGNSFTIDTAMNTADRVYELFFIMDTDEEAFVFSQYSGNGTDDRSSVSVTGLTQVEYVMISQATITGVANTNASRFRDGPTGDASGFRLAVSHTTANYIQDFDGLQTIELGDNDGVNESGIAYRTMAVSNKTGNVEVGVYTGDGSDPQTITLNDSTIDPDFIYIQQLSTSASSRPTTFHGGLAGRSQNSYSTGDFTSSRGIYNAEITNVTLGSFGVSDGSNTNTRTFGYIAVESTGPPNFPDFGSGFGGAGSSPFSRFDTEYAFFKSGLELEKTFKNIKII